MADTNGSGRLDRIEATLERMIEHHEAEFKKLMTWQVLMQDEVRKLAEEESAYRREQRQRDKALDDRIDRLVQHDGNIDERIDKLVSAIGELVRRLPAPQG